MLQLILVGIITTVIAGLILELFKVISFKNLFIKILQYFTDRAPKRTALLIYLSAGGTCRDPMAKVITEHILKREQVNFNLEIKALALGPVSKKSVSYAARKAVSSILNSDPLRNHIPRTITPEDCLKANLILVMDHRLLNRELPKSKTYLFKEFYGKKGDIADPWPDGKDSVTLERYLKCANDIHSTISNNISNLINALDCNI